MQVDKTRQDDQKNEECAKKDGDLVLSVEKEAWQSDGHILATVGAIWVAILSEVFSCFFVCQDLQSIMNQSSLLSVSIQKSIIVLTL